MSKDRRSRILIIVFVMIAVLAVMVFSILPENPVNDISSPLSVILRPVERFFSGTGSSIRSFFRALSENRKLNAELESLRSENVALRLQIKDNEQAAQAYEKLKQAFNMKDRFPEQKFIAANILQSPLDGEYSYYRLDVGKADGLDWSKADGFAVIDEEAHLVGKIAGADYSASKMLDLHHKGFALSVYGEKDAIHLFRLSGQGPEQNYMLAKDIPLECVVQEGDKVYSSGKGGVFPEGILCGTVISLSEPDGFGMRSAEIEIASSMENTEVVFVLLPRESERAEDGAPPGLQTQESLDSAFPMEEAIP